VVQAGRLNSSRKSAFPAPWQDDKIWVNYNISLTWIKAIWGWFPLLIQPWFPVRSQWDRYNLPSKMNHGSKKGPCLNPLNPIGKFTNWPSWH
jgi:hypothetical protein